MPKGKPITVNGKTLGQIAYQHGLNEETVWRRYYRGARTYEELSKPTRTDIQKRKEGATVYGQRLLQAIDDADTTLTEVAKRTGISRSCLFAFIYSGYDMSSIRLAKVCANIHVSMDYIMGV